MTPRPPLTLADIEPVLRSPDFVPGKTIMRLDLPLLRVEECRLLEADAAIEMLQRIADRLSVPANKVAAWGHEIERVISAGHTPIVSLWVSNNRAYITVDSLRIVPAAKA